MRRDVENNIGAVLVDMGKPAAAYEHLDAALESCDNPSLAAQIQDTYARAKLVEGIEASRAGYIDEAFNHLTQAYDYASASSTYFRQSGERKLFVESAKTLRRICEEIEAVQERERIREALDRAGGRISVAAKTLGIHHKTLADKLKFKKYEPIRNERQPERRPRGKTAK